MPSIKEIAIREMPSARVSILRNRSPPKPNIIDDIQFTRGQTGLGGRPTGSDILRSVQKITVRKKSSIKSAIWVSYDLGVQGDYPGIYSWLDEHQANECGDNLAFLNYEYSGSLLEALTADLKKSVDITKRTRIYVIYRDQETTKMKGNFIFGGRKAAPWSGFAVAVGSSESDEA